MSALRGDADGSRGSSSRLDLVVVGHVDHGKSTLVGRLLAETGAIDSAKVERVRELCRAGSKPFEYAFLIDALREERSQGVTIESARLAFRSDKREYRVIDAPGHLEFLKNMVSGAARADGAILVVDAAEGVQENSRRHATLLSLLGVRQVAVVVNKMDLVDYSREKYDAIRDEMAGFLLALGIQAKTTIPVVARGGENLRVRSEALSWHSGPTLLELIDSFEENPGTPGLPLRMPVQDVYKFTGHGDSRRIVAGTVESGSIGKGDSILFSPSGKRATVRSVEGGGSAGLATGFTTVEPVFVARGEIASHPEDPPVVSRRLRASVFWLGPFPFSGDKAYSLKLCTARVPARLESVLWSLDTSTLERNDRAKEVRRNEAAECVLALEEPVAFDLSGTHEATARFVLVDGYEIAGGGIIRESLADGEDRRVSRLRVSELPASERAQLLARKGGAVFVDGTMARAEELERRCLERGIPAFALGVDGDGPQLRRALELARILRGSTLVLLIAVPRLDTATERRIRRSFPGDDACFLGGSLGMEELVGAVAELARVR